MNLLYIKEIRLCYMETQSHAGVDKCKERGIGITWVADYEKDVSKRCKKVWKIVMKELMN